MRVLASRLKTDDVPTLREEGRMYGRLEQYLLDAEAGLKPLTPAERSAELLELRAHLEGLVQAEQELGSGPEEAVVNALAQFGPVQELTDEIVRVREEAQKAPVRQLALALLTSVAGGALSYLAYTSLRWTELARDGTPVRLIAWPAQLAVTAAPLVLGVIVGKAFPRALHARLPLGIAALAYLLVAVLPLIQPETLTPWLINPGQFFSDLAQRVFSQAMYFKLLNDGPPALVFVTLAWTAQSVARRSGPVRGFPGWLRAVLQRLPDSWVGGMTLFMVVGRLIHSLFSLIVSLSSPPPTLAELLHPSIATQLFQLIQLGTSGLVSGWVVGRVLPRRGWTGGIPYILTSLILTVAPQLMNTPKIQGLNGVYLWLVSGITLSVPMLTAYLVGQNREKRLAAR
jgi:hypothetical protein